MEYANSIAAVFRTQDVKAQFYSESSRLLAPSLPSEIAYSEAKKTSVRTRQADMEF